MKRTAGVLVLDSVIAGGPLAFEQKGGIDVTGSYDVVADWFKPLHEGRRQCVCGVAVESPNRIYVVAEVEVPAPRLAAGGCPPERYRSNDHSHFTVVVDGIGNVIEERSQWNRVFGFPHKARIPDGNLDVADLENQVLNSSLSQAQIPLGL